MARAIIHVDMDAFYASVEQRDNPALRGRPVIVGGTGPRGVVAAASYEARVYGVRSAMPGARARRLCPQGIFVRVDMARYRAVSRQVFEIFRRFSPLVQGLSLDEAFLDLTESGDDPVRLARAIKQTIARETGLTASVGVAHNKLLAKLASDYDKPDGFVHVSPDNVRRFLDPLPVRRLWGVGRRTAEKLRGLGILTVGQLRRAPTELLRPLLGNWTAELQQLAAGIDHRPVNISQAVKSISQETTFDRDCTSFKELVPVIEEQAEAVARRLTDKRLGARTVTVKIRSGGFSTVTRSETLDDYTADARRIAAVAVELLKRWTTMRSSFAIRLIGVGVSGLEEAQRTS